jgi:putative ABC transport system permease protein
MLKLKGIKKDYSAGDSKVEALRGIDLEFGESEFAAILGPSGCGKTTLLNIIGGLDHYSEGDLIIRGKSTREFTESDWDTFRNHSVGFVFQSYNLIPHQSVLANVELALTLSGVSREERRRRAVEVLTRVGLQDQLKKRPNQLSGGQMQRVAIARALVNNPDIVLADEPTGALDSETSIQIMDILREISREKLVIMVTHNPDLAAAYATRIINLFDGKIVSDSQPARGEGEPAAPPSEGHARKSFMSLRTAMSLSLNNLLTKKGRTLLTAFAGSIGIIGIALILSLSNGVNRYIERIQRDTLSSYPLEIDERTMDMSGTLSGLMGIDPEERTHEDGKVYSGTRMTQMMSSWMTSITENDLAPFKKWLESPESGIDSLVSGIQYEYNSSLYLYRLDGDTPLQVNPSTTLESTGMMDMLNTGASMAGLQQTMMDTTMRRMNVFEPMLDNPDLLASQYDILAGRMPEKMDEMVIILNSRNELSDYTLYTLGLKDQRELRNSFTALMQGQAIESEEMTFTYDELMNLRFRLLLPTDRFVKSGSFWKNRGDDPEYMKEILSNAMECRVVGILRPAQGSVASSMSGSVGYRRELTDYLLKQIADSEIVKEQLAHPDIDVFTGQVFSSVAVDAMSLLDNMDVPEFLTLMEEKGLIPAGMIPDAYKPLLTKDLLKQFVQQGSMMISGNSLDQNLATLGVSDPDRPAVIYIYPKNFEAKQTITDLIAEYNKNAAPGEEITYTDYVGLLMSSVVTITDIISYVLIAFVSISLVVSSIMIGIITYISVLERTKEIGILRAIGASRRDVSRVFNAETLIVGFSAGVIGILVTLLLILVANLILLSLTGIPNMASLPPLAGLILVAISMFLTLVAGLIPSGIAARKDPVVALRTE